MSCIVLSPPCDLAIRADGKPKTDRILVCEIDDNDSVVSIITSGIEKCKFRPTGVNISFETV